MNQKTLPEVALKPKAIESGSEITRLDLLKVTDPATTLKHLDQATHNVLLGLELISVVKNACGGIDNILSEVKQWLSSALVPNPEDSPTLGVKISLKLRELDQLAEKFKHNGQNLLDGSLSVSAKSITHSYLVVGANGTPDNRINLNTSLNIPPINSKTLGLEILPSSSQKGLKGLMVLENALGIINRLGQRATALNAHLKEIQKHLTVAIENHKAASSAPASNEHARDILQVINPFIKKDTEE
jgi:flagellin-like hook-associated protein FlgL